MFSKAYDRLRNNVQDGLALPTALMLILTISVGGAIFSSTTIRNLRIVTIDQATNDTFQIAEGALHDLIRQMSTSPHLWREKVTLANSPAGYTQFSPLSYPLTNGIPSCSGERCQRSLFPTGGGIIKNFGPLNGDGDVVNTGALISDQLDENSPPDPDISLNGEEAWVQAEHMDESLPGGTSLGGDLLNNPIGGTFASNIRFRLTSETFRSVRNRTGRSTLVVTVEIPAA